MSDNSVPPSYFQALYEKDPDPWRFASSCYERDKYAATLAAIGEERIVNAWEVGCSIGIFTATLAARCETLLAVDVAETALEQSRRRCAHQPWVTFECLRIPNEWPDAQFDLIIFSEVLYFLSVSDIRLTAKKTLTSLMPRGRVVLVNWTGDTGHRVSGDTAVQIFHGSAAADLTVLQQSRHPGYRMDVFQQAGARPYCG